MSTGTDKLKADLHEVIGEARSSATSALQSTMEKVGCTKSQLQEKCHTTEDSLYQLVTARPGCSLAFAAVTGIAIGYLLGHKRGEF